MWPQPWRRCEWTRRREGVALNAANLWRGRDVTARTMPVSLISQSVGRAAGVVRGREARGEALDMAVASVVRLRRTN